ncbi:hypothetical protein PTE_00838 [Photorhabdus khanii NC19]|uniref:Uncharacterized protein n=1 Tax=Photorhabdus khanii NC19 TaxID=1004151 RepID=W3VCW1_9GAMM|nr:hypothetical protein PTE_00838 [Photorhabdus khanii NC19]
MQVDIYGFVSAQPDIIKITDKNDKYCLIFIMINLPQFLSHYPDSVTSCSYTCTENRLLEYRYQSYLQDIQPTHLPR